MTAATPRPVLQEISVIIPTLGRPILERSLAAIEAGTHWPAAVIVVDQGRNPDTDELCRAVAARGLSVRYYPSDQRGRALGVNRGIERAESRFVAVTDDDCLVEPEWLAALDASLQRDPRSIVTGRIEAAEGGNVPVVVTTREEFVQRRPRLSFDSLSGGNMGAARELLMELGLLDEDPCVATAEDAELAYRALRAGVALHFDPRAGVAHVDWREGDERGMQYDSYARSHGGFYGKYLRRGDLFIAARMAAHLLRAARRWIVGTIRGEPDQARTGRAYVLHLPAGAIAGWRGQPIPGREARADQ
jgi:GT2 family glycosyltransferase